MADSVGVVTRIRFVFRYWRKMDWRRTCHVLRDGVFNGCYVDTELSARVSGAWMEQARGKAEDRS